MPKITPRENKTETILAKTKAGNKKAKPGEWWRAQSKKEMAQTLIATVSYLKEQQQYRYRQTSLFARLYSNFPLFGFAGLNMSKISVTSQLPSDRPTLNIIQSCIDTKVSRIIQSKSMPTFLTEGADYKKRNLAKRLNNFIAGEFYQTKADEMSETQLLDAEITGTGVIKVVESMDNKVGLERRLLTELLVDPNDSLYGNPRQLYEVQLIDRSVLAEKFPKYRSMIEAAEAAYPDNGGDSSQSISDLVMVAEGFHLPSGKDAKDGIHAIACSEGLIFDEDWNKQFFPYDFLHDAKRLLGFWGQGAAERLMGTQSEINKLLQTISASINLVGVPRVFVEDGSKVVKASINNQIGAIVTYRGTKPIYEVAPCMPQEVYAQLQRLVEYAYQQEGVSTMAAQGKKPAGLDSGEAIRNYDDLQTDRFASLEKRFVRSRENLAYLIMDKAQDIARRDGKYQTVYPSKDGTRKIDLPNLEKDMDDFIIQCFDVSSLPRDPAGRLQKVTEMIQSGMITLREGRRLLDFPDLQQVEKLANAAEERILQILDEIVEKGKMTPPDPFMDLQLAQELSVQYYNLYVAANLEEDKAEMLRNFNSQVKALMMEASQPPPGAAPQGPQPLAAPEPRPTSPLVPNVPVPGVA